MNATEMNSTDDTLTIQDIRRRGVNTDALCKRIGINAWNLQEYLNGRRPTPWIQRAIAEVLGVAPAELWPGSHDD